MACPWTSVAQHYLPSYAAIDIYRVVSGFGFTRAHASMSMTSVYGIFNACCTARRIYASMPDTPLGRRRQVTTRVTRPASRPYATLASYLQPKYMTVH